MPKFEFTSKRISPSLTEVTFDQETILCALDEKTLQLVFDELKNRAVSLSLHSVREILSLKPGNFPKKKRIRKKRVKELIRGK